MKENPQLQSVKRYERAFFACWQVWWRDTWSFWSCVSRQQSTACALQRDHLLSHRSAQEIMDLRKDTCSLTQVRSNKLWSRGSDDLFRNTIHHPHILLHIRHLLFGGAVFSAWCSCVLAGALSSWGSCCSASCWPSHFLQKRFHWPEAFTCLQGYFFAVERPALLHISLRSIFFGRDTAVSLHYRGRYGPAKSRTQVVYLSHVL